MTTDESDSEDRFSCRDAPLTPRSSQPKETCVAAVGMGKRPRKARFKATEPRKFLFLEGYWAVNTVPEESKMSVISDEKTCNLNEERFSSHTCVANNAETAEDGQSLGLPSKATSFQPAWLRSGNMPHLAGLASGGAELCFCSRVPRYMLSPGSGSEKQIVWSSLAGRAQRLWKSS